MCMLVLSPTVISDILGRYASEHFQDNALLVSCQKLLLEYSTLFVAKKVAFYFYTTNLFDSLGLILQMLTPRGILIINCNVFKNRALNNSAISVVGKPCKLNYRVIQKWSC